MNRINPDTTHPNQHQKIRRTNTNLSVNKTALSVLGMFLIVNDQSSMGPSLGMVAAAAEETILCSVDADCKSLNDYYICKPIAEDEIAER